MVLAGFIARLLYAAITSSWYSMSFRKGGLHICFRGCSQFMCCAALAASSEFDATYSARTRRGCPDTTRRSDRAELHGHVVRSVSRGVPWRIIHLNYSGR